MIWIVLIEIIVIVLKKKEKINYDKYFKSEKPIFSLKNLNDAYVNRDNIKISDGGCQNKFKDFEEKEI